MRWRWAALVVAAVLGFGAAFAIGSATKKTSSRPAATSTNLAPAVAGAPVQAAVTALNGSVAVPKLRVPPPAKRTTTASASSTATSAAQTTPASSATSSSPVTVQQSAPTTTAVQQAPPPTVQQTTPQQTHQQTTGGGGGVSHGGT